MRHITPPSPPTQARRRSAEAPSRAESPSTSAAWTLVAWARLEWRQRRLAPWLAYAELAEHVLELRRP